MYFKIKLFNTNFKYDVTHFGKGPYVCDDFKNHLHVSNKARMILPQKRLQSQKDNHDGQRIRMKTIIDFMTTRRLNQPLEKCAYKAMRFKTEFTKV